MRRRSTCKTSPTGTSSWGRCWWFFTISVSGRDTSSPESVMEEELNRLKEVTTAEAFKEVLERIISSPLTSDFSTLLERLVSA